MYNDGLTKCLLMDVIIIQRYATTSLVVYETTMVLMPRSKYSEIDRRERATNILSDSKKIHVRKKDEKNGNIKYFLCQRDFERLSGFSGRKIQSC